jgi:hypothetical protein
MPRRRFVPATGISFVGETGRRTMLKGIVKAILTVSVVVIADHYFSNGFYTDSTLSMLRQIRHCLISWPLVGVGRAGYQRAALADAQI